MFMMMTGDACTIAHALYERKELSPGRPPFGGAEMIAERGARVETREPCNLCKSSLRERQRYSFVLKTDADDITEEES